MINSSKPRYNPDGSLKLTYNPNMFEESQSEALGLSNYANKYTNNTFTSDNTFNNVNVAGTFTKGIISDDELNHLDGLTQNVQNAFNNLTSFGLYSNSITFSSVNDIPKTIMFNQDSTTSILTLPIPTGNGIGFTIKTTSGSGSSYTVTVACVGSNRFRTLTNTGVNENTIVLSKTQQIDVLIANGCYYVT